MKKILLLLILLFSLIWLLWLPSGAVDLESNQFELDMQLLKYGSTDHVKTLPVSQQGEEFGGEFGGDEGIFEYDYKSPKKAFVYSLLVPGLGQRYAESHALKTLAFIGIEVGLWMGYFNRNNKGDITTDDFEKFADAHWFEGDTSIDTTYRGWMNDYPGEVDEDDFTHHLSERKDQEYYEMIGKYDQFRAGWDDYGYWSNDFLGDTIPGQSDVSANRETYLNKRKEANDYYDMANKFLIFAMVNHLVAAFDAALSAKRFNKTKAAESWLSIKTEMKKYSATEKIPIVKLTYRF